MACNHLFWRSCCTPERSAVRASHQPGAEEPADFGAPWWHCRSPNADPDPADLNFRSATGAEISLVDQIPCPSSRLVHMTCFLHACAQWQFLLESVIRVSQPSQTPGRLLPGSTSCSMVCFVLTLVLGHTAPHYNQECCGWCGAATMASRVSARAWLGCLLRLLGVHQMQKTVYVLLVCMHVGRQTVVE